MLLENVVDPDVVAAEDEGVDAEADFGGKAEEGLSGVAVHAVVGK